MNLAYRRLSACAALLLAACPPNGNMTTAGPDTSSSGDNTTSGSPTSSPTTTPTTGPTTGEVTTTEASSGGSTATGSTTGPSGTCAEITDQNSCDINPNCKWASIVNYTHGTQGCQGNIRDFCIPKNTSGGITSVWKDNNGDIEVLQFGFDPTGDLGPDWKVCDCDGPLACLCTGAALDCPDRLGEFCGTITGQNGCENAAASGTLVCGWFSTSAEGPNDMLCDDEPVQKVCLPATNVGANTCDKAPLPPYPECGAPQDPIFWRDNAGIIEVTKNCGPEPLGWTKCLPDEPNQPAECKCRCL